MAAAMQRYVDNFVQGGRAVFQDLSKIDFRSNPTGIVLLLILVGIITLALYANLSDTIKLPEGVSNFAAGTKGVVQRPGDPPLPPPTEIVALRIYPIKSCRGIEIDSTRLKRTGLTLDRNWMFISKSDRKFLTIRSDPSMTLIDTNIITSDEKGKENEQLLEISIHGTDARVAVPAFPTQDWLEKNTTLSTVEIWEAETDGWEYSDEVNKIFSEFFKQPVALIYKGPKVRPNAVNGRKELYGTETPHHFADVVSLLVASEASIKDLNKRLGYDPEDPDRLTIERFRPNVIVRGRDDHPWEEDTWKRIRISTTIPEKEALYKIDLDAVARCARCQVPNVNPATAEKHPKQPWDTLMKFRRVDQGGVAKYKPCFGMLCIPKNEGLVALGAKIEVLETTDKHLYNTRGFKDL